MMKSRTTQQFHRAFDRLSDQVKGQAREAYRLFQKNPSHPSLRFKKVYQSQPIYSARVSRDYRAVRVRRDDLIVWFWIGPHREYDRLLKRL